MSTEKRAREFYLSCAGFDRCYTAWTTPKAARDYTNELSEVIHVREVLDADADLGPGIAWAIKKLKKVDARVMHDPASKASMSIAAYEWLRDEARRLGIEVKP